MFRQMEKRKEKSELEKSVWEIIIDLQREIRELEEENKMLREELSKKSMEIWFDEKAKNIYISQKENILMWKIC